MGESSLRPHTRQGKVHIAFIDDGVHGNDFCFDMLNDLEFDPSRDSFMARQVSGVSGLTHGTHCAAIVQKFYPHFVCSSLKVLNPLSQKCHIHALYRAFEWCLEKDIDVINVSLGSVNYRDEDKLCGIVNRLAQKTLIICAQSNKGYITFPATFANVIGVRTMQGMDTSCYLFLCNSLDGIEIAASSRHELTTTNKQSFYTDEANSYAAPFVTALVCAYLEKHRNIDVDAIKRLLLRDAINTEGHSDIFYMKVDWIRRALVIGDHLPFLENISFSAIYAAEDLDAIKDTELLEDCDTFVFIWGHATPPAGKQTQIMRAGRLGKHIIAIDYAEQVYLDFSECTKKVWYSKNWLPRLGEIKSTGLDIPVLAVCHDSLQELLELCTGLSEMFKEAEYLSFVFVNDPLCVLYNCMYAPYEQLEENAYFVHVQDTLRADVLICGIYAPDASTHTLNALLQHVPLDILIRPEPATPGDMHDTYTLYFTDEETGQDEKMTVYQCVDSESLIKELFTSLVAILE